MSEPVTLATITITHLLTDGDTVVSYEARDGSGEPLALVEALGLLRLAEDTAIRLAMGEDDTE